MKPELVQQAWDYFKDVQTKETKYEPLLRPQDKPAIRLNKATMEKYRAEMKKTYYDPSRYPTYLEQLGISYPTVRAGNFLGALKSIECFVHTKAGCPWSTRRRSWTPRRRSSATSQIGQESSVWMNVVVRGDVHCDPDRATNQHPGWDDRARR